MATRDDPRKGNGGRKGNDGRKGNGGGHARRAGQGRAVDETQRGGSPLVPRVPRRPEPAIADGVTGKELDRSVRDQLRTLSKENAQGVAQHLVMAGLLLDEDLPAALAHAETAVRRAGRVPAAREALGVVAYRSGDWSRALTEFRTARRLSGSSQMLALMVDCERALGRHTRALDTAMSPEAKTLTPDEQVELAIVVSGIRRDLGQPQAAAAVLELPALRRRGTHPWSARLFYAYAEAQLALGQSGRAREWFARAAAADPELGTDAAERLDELDGLVLVDLDEDEQD